MGILQTGLVVSRLCLLFSAVLVTACLVISPMAFASVPDCKSGPDFACLPLTVSPQQAGKTFARQGLDFIQTRENTARSLQDIRLTEQHVRTGCFPRKLLKLVSIVRARYGKRLLVISGYRSRDYNRRVGGAKRSEHIHCTAVDFRIEGVNKYELARFVKSLTGVGGVGTYCNGAYIHMDIGRKRSWHKPCRKKRTVRRKAPRRKTGKVGKSRKSGKIRKTARRGKARKFPAASTVGKRKSSRQKRRAVRRKKK